MSAQDAELRTPGAPASFWAGAVDRGLRLGAHGAVFGAVAGTVILAGAVPGVLLSPLRESLPAYWKEGLGSPGQVALLLVAGLLAGALGGASVAGLLGVFVRGWAEERKSRTSQLLCGALGMYLGGQVGLIAFVVVLLGTMLPLSASGIALSIPDLVGWLGVPLGFLASVSGFGAAAALVFARRAPHVSRLGGAIVGVVAGLTVIVLASAQPAALLVWAGGVATVAVAGCTAGAVCATRPGKAVIGRPWVVAAVLVAGVSSAVTLLLWFEGDRVRPPSGGTPPAPPLVGGSGNPRQDLYVRVLEVNFARPPASPSEVQAVAADIREYMKSVAGQPDAEACLSFLLDLPRSGDAPTPPSFPFDAEAARKYQRDYAAWRNLPVEFVNGEELTFVLVPPGTFLMGSPDDEPGHDAGGYDETRHPVTLTEPFYLAKYEVTVGQFRRFVRNTDHVTDAERNGGGHAHDAKAVWEHRPGADWLHPGYAGPYQQLNSHPVVHVSHDDAEAFCRWLRRRSSAVVPEVRYSLPTEAQWEWACRAGSGDRYWWGPDEDSTGNVANVGDRSLKAVHPEWPRTVMAMDDGHAFVARVGSYRPNAFGLHDMLGNVWEHCATHYGPYPREAVTDPADGDPKRGFAVRGGGWSNVPADVRCASRNADAADFAHSNLGFRVALYLGQ